MTSHWSIPSLNINKVSIALFLPSIHLDPHINMAAARGRSVSLPKTGSGTKPLRGFSFFFEAEGKDVKILQQKITSLGGKVDDFLSNHVNYFICSEEALSNKKQPAPRRSPRLTRSSHDTLSRANKILQRAHAAVAKEVSFLFFKYTSF